MSYPICPECGRSAFFCPDHPNAVQVTSQLIPGGSQECSKCHQVKPLDQFSRNNAMPGGRNKTCKTCRAAYDKAWQNRPDVRPANLKRMRDTNNARRKVKA